MAIVESAAAAYLSRYYWDDVVYGQLIPPGEIRMRASTEVEYLVRLRSPYTGAYSNTFDLYGRADGVVDHGLFLELTEDKLVGQIDAVSVKKTRGDRQLSLGAYALWRVTGKPVRKVRKRFTKKPQIRQRKGESVAEFCERIRADYRERPDFYMHEETTFRDADDMLDVERSLWDWAEQRRAAARRGFWPMNTDRCHDYGGCDFLDKCFRRRAGPLPAQAGESDVVSVICDAAILAHGFDVFEVGVDIGVPIEGDTRSQGFAKLDDEAAGGSKVFCSEVWAGAFNHVVPSDIEDHVAAMPWPRPERVFLYVNAYDYDIDPYVKSIAQIRAESEQHGE
jgi:hypothetical protein